MAKACIYSIEPIDHGGVIAKVRVAKNILDRFGHSTSILYTAAHQVPTTSLIAKLWHFIRRPFPYKTSNVTASQFDGYAVPHYPLSIWRTNKLPAYIARKGFANADIHFVISGSNHVGWPATTQDKPYIIWIGTLYQDELAGRAERGSEWAKQMQIGRNRQELDKQEYEIFKNASVILTNGGHTAQRIAAEYPDFAAKTQVAIYPVDTDIFAPPAKERKPFLLFTARINDERKDVYTLFETLRLVRQTYPNMRLKLTGEAPVAWILDVLEKSGQGDYVDFLGYLSTEDLAQLYQDASVFVLSSNQEGLGIVMLEAMASGLPIVSTKCGGPESVIMHNETGFLVDVGDAKQMAAYVSQILDSPILAKSLSEKSRQYALDNFSLTAVEHKIVDALKSVYPALF